MEEAGKASDAVVSEPVRDVLTEEEIRAVLDEVLALVALAQEDGLLSEEGNNGCSRSYA